MKMVIYFTPFSNKRFKNNSAEIRFLHFGSLFLPFEKDVSLQIWSCRAHFHIILSPFIPRFFQTLANILMAQRRKDKAILSFSSFIHGQTLLQQTCFLPSFSVSSFFSPNLYLSGKTCFYFHSTLAGNLSKFYFGKEKMRLLHWKTKIW